MKTLDVKDATIMVLSWRARWFPFLRTPVERLIFAGLDTRKSGVPPIILAAMSNPDWELVERWVDAYNRLAWRRGMNPIAVREGS